MVKVKPIDVVRRKWEERASVAVDDYKFGIQTAEDWAAAAERAYDRWAKALQAAIAEKRYVGGVRAAGTEKWKKKALEVGADRYASGVRAATDEYARKMSEVLRVIEGISLPEKGPKGDPKNIERVRIVAETLHKWAMAKKKA